MPELPEVETIRQDLKKKVLNKKIVQLFISKKKIVKHNLKDFSKIIVGNKFFGIERLGKLLIFFLDKDKYLLIHLKMTGQLIYQKGKKTIAGGHSEQVMSLDLPNKYSHIIFTFSDSSKLFFNDMRQFGYMKIVDNKELTEIKEGYGIEPLRQEFNANKLVQTFKNRKASIKSVLLNQKFIAGIGNIYADEILFKAGIKPNKQAGKIKKEEAQKIYLATKQILKQAIKNRGTTFNDYVDADGNKGKFLKLLKVYQREGKKCRRCKKGIIKKTKVSNRGTRYCDVCQK